MEPGDDLRHPAFFVGPERRLDQLSDRTYHDALYFCLVGSRYGDAAAGGVWTVAM